MLHIAIPQCCPKTSVLYVQGEYAAWHAWQAPGKFLSWFQGQRRQMMAMIWVWSIEPNLGRQNGVPYLKQESLWGAEEKQQLTPKKMVFQHGHVSLNQEQACTFNICTALLQSHTLMQAEVSNASNACQLPIQPRRPLFPKCPLGKEPHRSCMQK